MTRLAIARASILTSCAAAQVLKLHDLVHAAYFHAPVKEQQLTQLHCDADGPHDDVVALFRMADFDHSGTVSADGLTTHEPAHLHAVISLPHSPILIEPACHAAARKQRALA